LKDPVSKALYPDDASSFNADMRCLLLGFLPGKIEEARVPKSPFQKKVAAWARWLT
jgi:hypothetical protein